PLVKRQGSSARLGTPTRKLGQSAGTTSRVGTVRVDPRTAAYFAGQMTTGGGVCWYRAFASYNIYLESPTGRSVPSMIASLTSDSRVNSGTAYTCTEHA